MSFKPALVVVDMQEDFCPPHGSLAVTGGRDIVAIINELLSLPFTVKVATKDFHPQDHISFASNHPAPNNKPFVSKATITNPYNPDESQETQLWPDHCVQGTKGAELLPELNVSKIDHIIEKGQDRRVEIYSAFADPFKNPRVTESDLAKTLRDARVTDVFVVGLAADYCVKCTAIDSANEGFNTWVIGEATKAVDPSSLEAVHQAYEKVGVSVIDKDAVQVERVRELAGVARGE
ncbi:hypothetical protein HBH51_087750 [Parastagonospora nodorum]|nr:hypothetical protein HBH51_087750 [Parastagonospora nodorum]